MAEAFAEFVNRAVAGARQRRVVPYPLVAPEGGKEALLAQMTDFTAGSDHEVYTDSILPDSVDLPERLAGPLHPYQP